MLSIVPGSVTGDGTMLTGQDSFAANVVASIVGGVPSFSGQLSFSDSNAGDSFQSATITSVQISPEGSSVGQIGPVTTGSFTITGTATLNGGSDADYNFSIGGSLPVPTISGSTGGLDVQITGPSGFSYKLPWTPWDAGETVGMAVSTPQLLPTTTSVTSSALSTVFGQSVTFTADVLNSNSSTPINGSVTFLVDGISKYSAQTSNGQVSYTTTGLGVGSHTIVADFHGTSIAAVSQGSASDVVNQASTTTNLTSSSSFNYGQSVVLTSWVSAVSPGAGAAAGTITFYDGATPLGTLNVNGTSVSLTVPTGLGVGTHQLSAVYSGNTNFGTSTSATLNKTVQPITSHVQLVSSSNPALAGNSVTFSATVAAPTSTSILYPGTPTGSVVFYDGATTLGTSTLSSSGIAQLTASFAESGSHSIQAAYTGDSNYAPSSTTISESVSTTKVNSSMSFSALATLVVPGMPIPYTVTLNPAATGTVTLTDGTTVLGTSEVAGGVATFNFAPTTVGQHTIKASYSGDGTFNSGSSSLTVTVIAPLVSTISGQGTILNGQDAIGLDVVTALTGGTPGYSGTLTFTDSKNKVSLTAVSITSAAFLQSGTQTPSFSTNGGMTVVGTATLNGDPNTIYTFYADMSLPFPANTGSTGGLAMYITGPNGYGYSQAWQAWGPGQTMLISSVPPAGSSLQLSSSANPMLVGNSVTFTAAVTPALAGSTAIPTGTVVFYQGTTTLGTRTLDGTGTASWTGILNTPGYQTITADYAGDSNFAPSSAQLGESETFPTTLSLASSVSSPVFGQSESFTATLSSGSSSVPGQVNFSVDGGTPVAILISNNRAVFSTSALIAGNHTITATYAGTSEYAASQASVNDIVGQASTTTNLTTNSSFSYGQSVVLTAWVTAVAPGAGTAAGTITFMDGSTPLGTLNVNGTSVSLTLLTGLSVGAHQLMAMYSGNANYSASSSSTLNKTVQALSSSVQFTSSSTTTLVGNSVTFTAAVNGPTSTSITLPGTPTGSVTFYDGTTTLGSATLGTNGLAQFTASFATSGSHLIQAAYSGDSNYASSSATITETVASTKQSPSVNMSVYASLIMLGASLPVIVKVNSSATGTITLSDGGTVLGTSPVTNGAASFTFDPTTTGTHNLTASYSGDGTFNSGTSTYSLNVIPVVANTITGQGTILNGQDTIGMDVVTTVSGGVPSYSGTLSFVDTKNKVSLTALTFTSSAFSQSGLQTPNFSTNGGMTVMGTASLASNPTAIYTFYANMSLPFPANAGSTGGLAMYITGPNGYLYSQVWQPWNAGQTMLISTSLPFGTATQLTTSASQTLVGNPVTLTATVSGPTGVTLPGAPTGSVNFYDGTTPLGSATVNGSGTAQLSASFSTSGTHTVQAVYSGDSNFAGSSATISESVSSTKVTPSISLTELATFVAPGTAIPYTATLNSSATGTVTFLDGTTVVATSPVVNGVATFTLVPTTLGQHAIKASYSGDGTFNSASSATNDVSVIAVVGGTISGQGSILSGQDVLNLNVSSSLIGGVPSYSGTLTYSDSKAKLSLTATAISDVTFWEAGTQQTTSYAYNGYFTIIGTASLASNPGAVYTFYIDVSQPNSSVSGSTGGPMVYITGPNGYTYSQNWQPWGTGTSFLITDSVPYASTTQLAASVSQTIVGNPVMLTATVAGPIGVAAPTGSVTFYDGTTSLGSAPLNSSGVAQLSASFSTSGTHTIQADYGGDSSYISSVSASVSESVSSTKINPSVALSTLTSLTTPGTSLPFTVKVNSSATGTVTLTDGSTVVGSGTVAGGVATFNYAPTTVGTHSIKVTYSGDVTFNSGSSTISLVVNAPAASTITGQGTILKAQDGISMDIITALNGGVPSYSGSLTYTDSKANLSLTAVSITSVAFVQSGTPSSSFSTNGYFSIVGTATLNGDPNTIYTFYAGISLPYPANTGSTGGLSLYIFGPNGYSYSETGSGWDAGQTMLVSIN